MDFTSALKSKRENLSANSLKTYNSLLRTIYKNSFPEDKDKEVDIDKFTKEKGYVLEFLKSSG